VVGLRRGISHSEIVGLEVGRGRDRGPPGKAPLSRCAGGWAGERWERCVSADPTSSVAALGSWLELGASGAGRSSFSSGQVGRRSRQTPRASRLPPGRPCRGAAAEVRWLLARSRYRLVREIEEHYRPRTARPRPGGVDPPLPCVDAIAYRSTRPRRGLGFHFRRSSFGEAAMLTKSQPGVSCQLATHSGLETVDCIPTVEERLTQ